MLGRANASSSENPSCDCIPVLTLTSGNVSTILRDRLQVIHPSNDLIANAIRQAYSLLAVHCSSIQLQSVSRVLAFDHSLLCMILITCIFAKLDVALTALCSLMKRAQILCYPLTRVAQ